jgi:hypothetical protein
VIGPAPDYIEPVVGWRLWHVAERDGALRLISPLYRTTWLPRRGLVGTCRLGLEPGSSPRQSRKRKHSPPVPACGCGIYASRTPSQAAAYLTKLFKQREDVLHRVIGTVSLWGNVVECEWGWRASHAYPQRIYVPVSIGTGRLFFGRLRRSSPPAEEIALGLAEYAVRIEVVESPTLAGLAEALETRAIQREAA